MFANRYTVFVDACSLASAIRRNMILSLAEAGFFRVQWSEDVLAETERAIADICRKKDIASPEETAARQVGKIREAFPEAAISDYGHLVSACTILPDADDAHVLAAAVHAEASTLVTENLSDFPPNTLSTFRLEAKNADDFLADTMELDLVRAVAAMKAMRERFQNPPLTAADLIARMEDWGMPECSQLLSPHIDSL